MFTRGEGTLLRLAGRGVVTDAASRLQIARQGGFSGLHLFLLAVLHLASSPTMGLQPFCASLAPYARALAAPFGQARLPSASSSSRLLSSVPSDLARTFGSWLLGSALDTEALLQCKAALCTDTHGGKWDLFDYDPTVEALLRRPLREESDAPPSRRRSEGLATPGYLGRKRGDVRFRRSAMQHAGLGLWVHAQLDDGKGDPRVAFQDALDAARALVGPDRRILVRMDCEFSGVPYLDACIQSGTSFVTRLSRYSILERESVRERLRKATWTPVANSAGQVRYAADLGWCRLDPADETLRTNGEAFAPATVRIVVTRTHRSGEAWRGIKDGDEQVEMFATDLDAGAWPAAAVVECYQQRSSLENRFAREDRAFGLDRIFSYHLPGQELVTVIGLFLWNLQIIEGFALQPVPTSAIAAPQLASPDVPASLRPLFADEAPEVSTTDPTPPSTDADPKLIERTDAECVEAIEAVLDSANWSSLPPEWTRLRGQLALQCPAGRPVPLSHFQVAEPTPEAKRAPENRVSFRTGARFCVECPLWQRCHPYPDDTPEKKVGRALPYNAAVTGAGHFRALQQLRRRRPDARPRATSAPSARFRPALWGVEDRPAVRGPYRPALPTFRSGEAQKLYLEALDRLRIEVRIGPTPARQGPTPHRLVRPPGTSAMPSRQTWEQRLRRYALAPGARVTTFVYGTAEDRAAILGASRPNRRVHALQPVQF